MKFTQNTPIISPTTIGNSHVHASRDVMAYGTAGKDKEAIVAGLGQVMRVAQQQQDDMDAADHMARRNAIMGNITKRLYGEDGLITNGVGINAKGLTDRVQQVVQEEFDRGLEGANQRVRRSMAGTFNENMGNYQRIAAQQEGREFKKQKDSDYGITINNGVNMSMLNYQNADIVDSNINDLMNIVDYRAKDQGFSETQRQQERRKVLTAVVSGAMQAAIDDSDLDTASIYADRYGKYMDQGELMKYQKVLRQETRLKDEKNEIEELTKKFVTASGEPDWNRIEQEIKSRAKQTKVVGGGSGVYSGDAQTDALIQKYANKYNLPVDLFAALGSVESNFNNSAVSGVGAKGMFQLMPDTAASLGVDPDTLEGNIEGGAKYLRQMLDMFGGNEDLAIAAYNAGPGAVKDAGNQIPNYAETQNHVKKVRDARKKYRGGVSFEKLDPGIDASGVDLTGTKPRTIGMINYAYKVYKEMFNLDDFWVSCTTGGHAADSPHGQGEKADVGGSALKDINNLKKYQQALQAAGIGCNDEYNYKSQGWTGPHLDLDARGTNWQTREEFGGFKGGGGGGRTVNAHDSGYEDRMIKRMEAARADWNRRKKDEASNRLQGYQAQIQQAGSAANALSILERIKSSEQDPNVYSAAIQTARTYYPDAFKVSNNITGTRRSGSTSSRNTAESRGENAADVMAVELGSGRKITAETLVKVRNYNKLNQEDWDYLHSAEIQAGLADMLDNNNGDLQATYNQLASKYGERAAAQILATADDGYFG